jgi:hypothetical protein
MWLLKNKSVRLFLQLVKREEWEKAILPTFSIFSSQVKILCQLHIRTKIRELLH